MQAGLELFEGGNLRLGAPSTGQCGNFLLAFLNLLKTTIIEILKQLPLFAHQIGIRHALAHSGRRLLGDKAALRANGAPRRAFAGLVLLGRANIVGVRGIVPSHRMAKGRPGERKAITPRKMLKSRQPVMGLGFCCSKKPTMITSSNLEMNAPLTVQRPIRCASGNPEQLLSLLLVQHKPTLVNRLDMAKPDTATDLGEQFLAFIFA